MCCPLDYDNIVLSLWIMTMIKENSQPLHSEQSPRFLAISAIPITTLSHCTDTYGSRQVEL
eukprot:1017479-Amorphochlora_amoeboformis.AAC.1